MGFESNHGSSLSRAWRRTADRVRFSRVAAPNPSALNVLTGLMGSFWQRQPNPAPTELAFGVAGAAKLTQSLVTAGR
jgi:hypothetical protein